MNFDPVVRIYWNGAAADIQEGIENWRENGFKVQVFDEPEIAEIIAKNYDLEYAQLFLNIRIPTCQSFIARFIILEEFGGIYSEAHTAIGSKESLAKFVTLMGSSRKKSKYDLIVFEKKTELNGQEKNQLTTSFMLGRQRSLIYMDLQSEFRKALRAHYELEKVSKTHVGYNIYALAGAWRVFVSLFDVNLAEPAKLKSKYREKVGVFDANRESEFSPFKSYKYYKYRQEGHHWSERQKLEPLFNWD